MISKKKNWDGLNWIAKIFKKQSCLLKKERAHDASAISSSYKLGEQADKHKRR